MLSCMQTALGLMVMSPSGDSLRIPAGHFAFSAAKDILAGVLPDKLAWARLKDLMSNPLQAVTDWAAKFGVSLKGEKSESGTELLAVNGSLLKSHCWLPAFQRMAAVGGTPKLLMDFHQALGEGSGEFNASSVCLHLDVDCASSVNLVRLVTLPLAAEPGMQIVGEASQGEKNCLVSFSGYSQEAGVLSFGLGRVLRVASNLEEALSYLSEPATLGFDRTYQCEEGTATGWSVDLSFDTLTAARENLVEMANFGATDARIINKITGQTVH